MAELASSRYTIAIPLRHGRLLAYNSLSGALAVMDRASARIYRAIRSGKALDRVSDDTTSKIVKQLKHGSFIVDEQVDELAFLKRLYDGQRYRMDVMTLTIAPTIACNFGCDYCFQGQDKPGQTMSQEVQDATVALVQRVGQSIRQLGVAWYGGEPLLRLGVIQSLSERIIDVCQRKRVRYDANIVTNGYLLTGEVARTLCGLGVRQAQVTLDGPQEHHDTRRHLLSRRGTFDRIVENLRQVVDESQLQVSIRVNIDDRNRDDIYGLIDRLAELGLGHRPQLKMYFAPVEAITEGCHLVEDMCLSKSRYAQLEAELHRHGYEAGLTALPYPPRFHGTCAAVRPRGFVIVPNGDLHKCWDTVTMPHRRVGTLFELEALNTDPTVRRWLGWTPFANDTCKNCKLLPSCAGACAYKFVYPDSTRGEAAILPCPSWKYNMNERLLHHAEAQGVITADDYDLEATRTVPSELCADVHITGGEALPDSMMSAYEHQKRIRRLPMLREETGA